MLLVIFLSMMYEFFDQVIVQFSDLSDGDYEWAFKANKSDENHIKAKAAVQSFKKDIQKLLEKWIAEFKQI